MLCLSYHMLWLLIWRSLGNPLLTDAISEEIAVLNPCANIYVDAGCLVNPMVSNQLLGGEAVQPVVAVETVSALSCPVSVEHVEPIRNSLIAAMPEDNRVDISDVQGNLVVSHNLVDVPVNVITTNSLMRQVGGKTGVDVRSHGDWMHNSSEGGSDSDSYSDPGNEYKMVRDRPISGSFRGKFWGRGGRKR
ncbi:hypothetical protein MA16_Dca004805 [Dendrobium catenatum]|uniref:Uncharacterized protein n=1 Tax=Dendrobium catenatum TaxID=906689 RepID=A0A2I0VP50_9ASPA|nr:hypothetical protein MA16_Dca004805 [Dendrobium catenatum]